MNRVVLPFEKEVITSDEMNQHISWYLDKLTEALSEKDVKKQIRLFRAIRSNLNIEAKHYQKNKVEKFYKEQSKESLKYCEVILEIEKKSGYQNEKLDAVIDRLLSDFTFYYGLENI